MPDWARTLIVTVVVFFVLGTLMSVLDVDRQIRGLVLIVVIVMGLIGAFSKKSAR